MVDEAVLVWLALCVSRSLASFVTPSDVYISLLPPLVTSQERQAVLSAISQVNLDSSLLPNTTLHIVDVTLSEENLYASALNISQNKLSLFLVDSIPKESHTALSSLLHIPLLSTRPSRATLLNQSFSDYGVSIWPNSHAFMIDLITQYSWTNVIILYDVRWRDHASIFASSLPSKVSYLLVDMILDQTGLINTTTQNKLKAICQDTAEAVVLFCDASLVEGIIRQAHPLLAYKSHRTHRWLLADCISSLKLTALVSQIVVGFKPRVFSNPKTTALTAALSTNITDIKFSSFLVFDTVLAYAHALHNMLVANEWQALTTGSNIVKFKNGDKLLKYIKKVSAVGTTGVIQFDHGGHRSNATFDVMNLRGGTFMKIGEWSEALKLTMASPPMKNQPITKVVPLSQLQRKLKVALVEDPPFVMTEVDQQTNTKTLVGFSIDLIKELADILKFQYEFYLSPDGKYSGTNPDGSLSGVIGEVFKENADMSSMPLTITSERQQYMGFSKPFMYISMDLVMQKPKVKGFDITGFMTPYTIQVWVMTLVTWIVVTAILTLVNYFSPYGHRLCDEEQNGDEFSWFNSMWFCLASMLQQGGDATPRMLSGRIVVGSFWFCILVWVSTYTANLAAFLTSSKMDAQINTLDDVLEREYSLYIMRDTALYEYFKTSDYRLYRLLWQRMASEKTFVDSASEGFKFVRKNERTVYMEDSPFAEYLVNQEPCDVMSAKDVTGSSSYGIAMAKNFPYINNISIAIVKLQEVGKLEDLKRKWWNQRTKCPEIKQLTSDEIIESKRIQIGSMVGVYILLAGGGVISIVVIFIEIWWKSRRDRINAKVRKGWAVVKGAKTVIGLQKQTSKPDARTVVQAFQIKQTEEPKKDPEDLGIVNKACDAVIPAIPPAANLWKVVSKTQFQIQVNEEPKVEAKDLGISKYSGTVPAKTPVKAWGAVSKTKIDSKDLRIKNNTHKIPSKTPSNSWDAVSKPKPQVQSNEEVKKQVRLDLRNANVNKGYADNFPAKIPANPGISKKKSPKVQFNEEPEKQGRDLGSNSKTSDGIPAKTVTKEKGTKKKSKKKSNKKTKQKKNVDDEEFFP